MNIIHVINRLGGGGAEVVAINLAIKQATKHKVKIITLSPDNKNALDVAKWQANLLQDNSIAVSGLGAVNVKLKLPILPFKLCSIIKKFKAEIVHSHTDLPDICVSLARHFYKFNIARTIHNTKIWDTWWLPGYISEKGFRDDLIISISDDTAQTYSNLRGKYKLRQSQHRHIIKNGVSVPPQNEWLKKNDLAARFNANVDKFQVGFFGRLTNQKGVDILIEAIEKLATQHIEFHIFGEGEDLIELSDEVKRKCLPVQFHRPVPAAASVMAAFDIIVTPSRFEGLPLVPLEAQMVGVPVLVTNAPGLREAVKPKWPLMVASENSNALANMLDELILGNYDLELLSREAINFSKDFSADGMAEQYEKAYLEYIR